MQWPNSFDVLYRQIQLRKIPFFFVFFVIVTLSYAFLYIIDFIPEPIESVEEVIEEEVPIPEDLTKEAELEPPVEVVSSPYPVKVIIDALDRVVIVNNPQSREIADLDASLLTGVVRHPDSASFSEKGNILILGHSSYLPNVFNKNFQAFNGIQELTWGDMVRVQSEDTEYVYRVQEVYKAKASDIFVPDTPGEARLTLATCNSFGSKDDRFIVEAVLVDTKPL